MVDAITYPVSASIKLNYTINCGIGGAPVSQGEYVVLEYTLTSEQGKKIMDYMNSFVTDKLTMLKNVSQLKVLLGLFQ